MAYDELLAERISNHFTGKSANFYAKKMMGGLCFMVEDKMCCGIHFDKKKNTDLLMARIGEDAYVDAIKHEACHPMDFTGRPMRGYAFITPDGFEDDTQLAYWLDLCLAFNPLAKASKKRKNKTS